MSKIKEIIKRLFSLPPCPECGGKIVHLGTDITPGGSKVEVYECQNCKKWWI